ncbi:YDG domain-containing protein [Parapedobacter indicus]|uniref:YDG domain-containing protein n=1 Tax=Parapedobacter indicus TaxID=1477437 RepID=UPI0015A6620E|nr:YDG domain-containing protein [Parapedobacter indicus]
MMCKGTATYEDGNAGTEKEITVSDFVLSGADSDNSLLPHAALTFRYCRHLGQ